MVKPSNDLNFWDDLVATCPVKETNTEHDPVFVVENETQTPVPSPAPTENVPTAEYKALLEEIAVLKEQIAAMSKTE